MRIRRDIFIGLLIVVILLMTGSWIAAKRTENTNKTNTNQVKIESVAPAFGSYGTEITVTGTGFSTDQNDIGFTFSPQSGNYTTGYINLVKSTDGKTITLKLPEAVGVCAASTAPRETACIELALILPHERVEIFVVNKAGTSNKVGFVIN